MPVHRHALPWFEVTGHRLSTPAVMHSTFVPLVSPLEADDSITDAIVDSQQQYMVNAVQKGQTGSSAPRNALVVTRM